MEKTGEERKRERGAFSVEQGIWGESVTCDFLRLKGWHILERDARPCAGDRRCDVDIIAYDERTDSIVFVEVKTHLHRSEWAERLWAVNMRKKQNLLKACSCWVMRNRWRGNFRFDVVEVYGEKHRGVPPEIDHIENVPLFPAKWRFWK